MSLNKFIIQTNAKRSHIESTETHYKLKSIPITVNGATMNGILYPKSENEKGIPTIVGKPFTIDHPVDKSGNFISATEGEGLTEFFSGGVVTNAYEVDDTWYVDAEIKKSLLMAQNNGKELADKLEGKEDLGVSTGLYFNDNKESGHNEKGEAYNKIAKGQKFNHLAAVDNPAGGSATTAVFNSENTFICNFEDIAINKEPEISDSLIDRIVNRIKPLFVNEKESGYNKPDLNTNNGDSLMNREEMLKALGLAVNSQITDEELKTLVGNKLAANNDSEKPQDLQKLVTEAVNAAVKPLQDQITANAEQELNGLAEQVAALNMGLDAEAAKKLGVDGCKNFLTANSATSVAGYPLAGGRQTVSTNSAESFADVDLNAGLEG